MKIKLHTQILIGFILGIIFGAIFSIDHYQLNIEHKNGTAEIKNWSKVTFAKGDSTLKSFSENSQMGIIRYFESLKKSGKVDGVKVIVNIPNTNESPIYEGICSINRNSSIGLEIKPIGEIFIRLLNMIAVPLVLASLIVGSSSLRDMKHLAKIGGKLLVLFLITAVVSVIIGEVLAGVIRPGEHISPETKTQLIDAYKDEGAAPESENYRFDIVSFLVNIVPKNPFKGLVEGDFLQIVFYAILTGLVLCLIPGERAKPVINFFEGITDAMIKMVSKVILIAPMAVFALISAAVAEFGFSILQTLFWYAFTVIIGLLIVTFTFYPAIVKLIGKTNPFKYYLAQKQVFVVSFSTSSSSATLPVTIDVCKNRLGISNRIASFILPIGTIMNKDGTALYQAVSAIFIAQVYGIHFGFSEYLTIFITCVITGAATAPVAGAGLIMLVVVLNAAGLPAEGIALVLGIDRILNMCRTTTNVVGDTVACAVIARSEGELGEIKTD